MILGMGIDIVNIERIEQALDRYGERFLQRIYTQTEKDDTLKVSDRVGVLAKRWAAKEACSKALGSGMRQGVAWRDIEITNRQNGMPVMALTGGALRRLTELMPAGREAMLHVTMTDDRPCAAAFVVIEAVRHHPLSESQSTMFSSSQH